MGSPEATLGLKSSSGRCGQEWSKEGWERRAVGLGGGQALQEPGCPAERRWPGWRRAVGASLAGPGTPFLKWKPGAQRGRPVQGWEAERSWHSSPATLCPPKPKRCSLP